MQAQSLCNLAASLQRHQHMALRCINHDIVKTCISQIVVLCKRHYSSDKQLRLWWQHQPKRLFLYREDRFILSKEATHVKGKVKHFGKYAYFRVIPLSCLYAQSWVLNGGMRPPGGPQSYCRVPLNYSLIFVSSKKFKYVWKYTLIWIQHIVSVDKLACS